MKISFLGILLIGACIAEPQLQLVNVIFRHGDRTPVPASMFPTDPHINSSFYPFGHGALTNDGKYRICQLGEFLRKKYQDFLGDVYLPHLLYARSSDFPRTKMSLQIVLAALFPPSDIQKWHNTLDWQPIPYVYVPALLDDVLVVSSQNSFLEEKKRVFQTDFIQNHFMQWKRFFSQLEKWTGAKITDTFDIIKIYDTLLCEQKLNLTLPSWSEGIFPDGKLHDATVLDYEVMMYDKKMINELTGKLAKTIRENILEATNATTTRNIKLFLYSGHEVNVAGTLKSLEVYHKYHIPNFASAVIIELLKDKDHYYVKVLYYDGESTEAEEMKLPGCSTICPLEKYLNIVNELVLYYDWELTGVEEMKLPGCSITCPLEKYLAVVNELLN